MGEDICKKNILLVDDESISQNETTAILSDKFNVVISESGKDALKLLLRYRPDLILLDIVMPEMDGWEIFHKIRGISLLQQVPIAFLTSLNDEEGLEQAKRLGASDCFVKPIDGMDFLNRVEKMIQG